MILMEGKFPLKTKEFGWRKVGDMYVLADEEKGKSYQLDAISFLVWIQCDGRTSVGKMVDVFSVDGNRDIIEAAITGVLEKLTSSGILKWV